jgi:hypothetical protein
MKGVLFMGLRFHKKIKILPGVDINLSKSGIGLSVGPKGAKVSVNPKGDVMGMFQFLVQVFLIVRS